MNTVVTGLSVWKALESSLSFLVDFTKKHWLIVILYIATAALTGFIINDGNIMELPLMKSLQLALLGLVSAILTLVLSYYSLSMAIGQLDPSARVFSKGIAKSVWQLFCVNFLAGIISVPLLLLFIAPGIWWIIKSSVSSAHLLSTEDGPIKSLRKSHELMNNRFWQCFGFLFGTGFVIAIVCIIGTASVGLSLFVGGMLHAATADAGISKVANLFRFMNSILSVFSAIVCYYLQSWLYVYLKNNPATQNIPKTQITAP